jgi:cytochrome c556
VILTGSDYLFFSENDRRKRKAEELGSRARAEIKEDMKRLKKKRATLRKEMKRLETKSRAEWEKAKRRIQTAENELAEEYKKLRDKFKSE